MHRREFCALGATVALAGCAGISPLESSEPDRSLNDSYTTDAGVALSVDRLEIVEGASGVVVGEETNLASREDGFVLTHLTAENTGDSRSDVPAASRFSAELDGSTYDPYQEDFSDAPGGPQSSISEPVSGPLFPASDTLDPGERTDGWLVFGVALSADRLTVELADADGNRDAAWTLSLDS